MTSSVALTSRIRGSLFGVAVTDALGGPVEFRQRGTFPRVTGFEYNSHFDLPPGTWTDDTSMTICLAQSLVDKNGIFNAEDQVTKYLMWYEQGYMSATGRCFDIGNATRIALEIWKDFVGKPGGLKHGQAAINMSLNHKIQCGNGSLMRVSPIALVYHEDLSLALEKAALSSQVTHPYSTNLEACKIYTLLIALALKAATKKDLADSLTTYPFGDSDLKYRFAKYNNLTSFEQVSEIDISSSGYVIHNLEASLWAFFSTETFYDGALKVVNLGDDADTVGAIYGGVAGAFYGVEAIPEEWLNTLHRKDILDTTIEGLVKLVTIGKT